MADMKFCDLTLAPIKDGQYFKLSLKGTIKKNSLPEELKPFVELSKEEPSHRGMFVIFDMDGGRNREDEEYINISLDISVNSAVGLIKVLNAIRGNNEKLLKDLEKSL